MVRRRETGSWNWARGAFAAFWILLAVVSGLYLFNVLSDPTLGGQLVKLSPASPGETASTAAGDQGSRPPGQELAAIQESLRALSQQVADLSGRLEERETSDAPASPEPPASAATSSPASEPAATAEDTAAPVSPPQPPEEPKPSQAEAPKPAEPPQPEAKPVEQAALDASQSPASTPEPAAPPKPYEPPPVVVSPLDELPAELEAQASRQPEAAPAPEVAERAEPPATSEPAPDAAPPAPGATDSPSAPEPNASSTDPAASPSPPPSTEMAALDPIALPPAANDGSTRYGIEIGIVAKQDGLRPLWREFLTKHAALVAGLQPRRVLAPDKKWRLIAGPFTSAAEASQACALFKKASRPCEATVYAGDGL